MARGAVVVDNSGAFRMDPEVPLVVPEVNAGADPQPAEGDHREPELHDADDDGRARLRCTRRWGLTELVVASYQAASGAGQPGVDRLYDELEVVAGDRTLGQSAGDVRRAIADKLGDTPSPFPAPLALNVVPWAGSLRDGGWSSEETEGPQRVPQDPRHPAT